MKTTDQHSIDNLLLREGGYPHLPESKSDELTLILNEQGKPVIETNGSVKAPANYSFECVNNFVHCEDPQYEELQYLALGMSNHIEQLEQKQAEAIKDQSRYQYVIDWLESNVTTNAAFTHARTRSEYDQAIDAALKEDKP